MVASQSPGNATWYTDSGATDHITSDINNLTSRSNYQGPDQVSVGNGAGLRISHVVSSFISSPFAQFRLSNTLHVPNIAANLISVRCFATDNNCAFKFVASDFCVKDKVTVTGRMLFHELSENGLYPFPLSIQSSLPNTSSTRALIGEKAFASVWHSCLGHPASTVLRHLL